MRRYVAVRGTGDLSGQVSDTAWQHANVAEVDTYPWYESGLKQATHARVLYNDRSLYLQFQCEDIHISADVRELNGLVCRDSCVEFFATPGPDVGGFFNFEANCCGMFHLGFGPDRYHRRLVSEDLAGRIRIVTSIPGDTKSDDSGDRSWWLSAEIPHSMLSEFIGCDINPIAGDEWRVNFYRCGGTDGQYACWNNIDTPKPDFHTPECFGAMTFA